MGSRIRIEDVGKEFNDTLKLSYAEGFPAVLKMNGPSRAVKNIDELVGQSFSFQKDGARKFHDEARVFLVQAIENKWLYWGHAKILEQHVEDGTTYGRYQITKLYNVDYQKIVTKNEAPEGKSYFLGPWS
jgi:hypothetical protein